MRDRIRCSFSVVVMSLLLLVSGSGPVATAAPRAPTYAIRELGTLGGPDSVCQGINDRGQVVGWASTAAGAHHAFLWEAGRGMQDLGTLGGNYSFAYAINAPGQVVGESQTAAGPIHAFLWEAGRGMQDLGTLGGHHSSAVAINARGQVVGRPGFLWGGYRHAEPGPARLYSGLGHQRAGPGGGVV
jgi:probable HAF family extracellular repeat protein